MKPDNKTAKKKRKEAQRKKLIKKVLILIFSLMVIETGLIIYFLARANKFKGSDEYYEAYEPEDTDTYFRNNAEVLSVTDAGNSAVVLSEIDAESFLKGRGFDAFPIECKYSMSGEYLDEKTDSDNTKHPTYSTYYQTADNNLWTITIVDNTIHAYPASYNMENGSAVLFCEEDTLAAYNAETNQFYELRPTKEATVIAKINRIDAEQLEMLTAEEIKKYVK